jgi:hypothetical protein
VGLTFIGNFVFSDCTSLALVTSLATTPPVPQTSPPHDWFENTHATLRIEVPAESVDAYKAAYGWSDYAERIFAIE